MNPPTPSKCAGPTGAGIEPNPCTTPGSLPRCQICPTSPTYWRAQPVILPPGDTPPPAPPLELQPLPTHSALDWSRAPTGKPQQCRICGLYTTLRTPGGIPMHKACAEDHPDLYYTAPTGPETLQ